MATVLLLSADTESQPAVKTSDCSGGDIACNHPLKTPQTVKSLSVEVVKNGTISQVLLLPRGVTSKPEVACVSW